MFSSLGLHNDQNRGWMVLTLDCGSNVAKVSYAVETLEFMGVLPLRQLELFAASPTETLAGRHR